MTGTGTGNGGNTLGGNGAGTGATSHHTVAQVGLDGCLVEPSRQARRAQALHKYKQKRKVGLPRQHTCFCTVHHRDCSQ